MVRDKDLVILDDQLGITYTLSNDTNITDLE